MKNTPLLIILDLAPVPTRRSLKQNVLRSCWKRGILRIFGCANQLPWVNAGKHLGTKLENKPGTIVKQDMNEKCVQYIQRNNELMQEFSYANSTTKTKINSIYNSHFTGSVLWDLFGHEAEMIYNTWNSSIKNMFRLDRTTHRHLIEPVRGTPRTSRYHFWSALWTSQINWCVQEIRQLDWKTYLKS